MEFWIPLLQIIMIDLVLGADNSIVIAMACRNIAPELRNKAILWGTAGAIGVRVVLTVIIVWLLNIPFLHLVGGLLLLWISYKLLVENDGEENIKAGTSLKSAIQTIIYADIIMGLDNMLAVGGAAKGSYLLVTLGLLISIPIIVWGSKIILNIMERYPSVIYLGAGILAYTAGEMIIGEPKVAGYVEQIPMGSWIVAVVAVGGVLITGYLKNKKLERNSKKTGTNTEVNGI